MWTNNTSRHSFTYNFIWPTPIWYWFELPSPCPTSLSIRSYLVFALWCLPTWLSAKLAGFTWLDLCFRTIAHDRSANHVFAQHIAYIAKVHVYVVFAYDLNRDWNKMAGRRGNRPHSATMAGGHLRCIPVFPLHRGFTNGGKKDVLMRIHDNHVLITY